MEHELSFHQVVACFIAMIAVFLFCAWLTTIEQAGY